MAWVTTGRNHLLPLLNRWLSDLSCVRLFTKRAKGQFNIHTTQLHRNCILSQSINNGFIVRRITTVNPRFFQLIESRLPADRNIANRLPGLYKKTQTSFIICSRYFHTSEAQRAAPILPVIGAVLARFSGPIAKLLKVLAVLAGRTFRKWWKKLPDDKKVKFKEQLFLRKGVIAAILSTLVGGWLFLYYVHLEITPYTNRSRYIGVTSNQIRDIAESQWRNLLETYADHIVPVTHPDHKWVFHIAERLIRANSDEKMENINWEVNVISSEEINAFVLPNGQIFVFTGLLRFLTNDDALAIILGHEIAHAILQHSAEQLCFHGFINLIKVVLLATIWALLPNDLLAFLTQFIQNALLGLFWHLPYSRALEEEADRVGLYFAAKACFDVREGPKVWERFDNLDKIQETVTVEWLSTHPSHENRERNLEAIVPEALALRKLCKCPELIGVPIIHEKVRPLTLSSMTGLYNKIIREIDAREITQPRPLD